ncbi:hypothetical protein [Acetobacterium sp.]|uniref:hypothetical protein n=1 Tax=Acetobacterium sp. TaxID=1872094 RepID=UPI003592F072
MPYAEHQQFSNAIDLSDGQYGLNSVGTSRIELDQETDDFFPEYLIELINAAIVR